MSLPLTKFVAWLGQTPLSQTIQTVSWIIPTVQTIHILAIAAAIGSMAMLDLRVLGVGSTNQSVSSVTNRLMPWVWVALVVLLCSGCVMIIGEPGRSLVNPVFQLKMVLVLTAAVTTIALGNVLTRRPAGEDTVAPPLAKTLAIVSLLLWVAIVFAGRWIAYGDTLFDYSGN